MSVTKLPLTIPEIIKAMNEKKALEKQVKELKKEINSWINAEIERDDRVQELRTQVEELKKYAGHKNDCKAHWIKTTSASTPKSEAKCTCGLDNLLND